MTVERYAGSAGEAQLRKDEEQNSGAARGAALAARRDLLFRLPPGRALDHEDLRDLSDESNQTNRAIIMRARLLKHVRGQLPSGVLVLPAELEHARGLEEREPARRKNNLEMPEWPSAG